MFKAILLLSAIAVACQGTPITEAKRHGCLNSYFIYTRDSPRVPIQLDPSNINNTTVRYRARTAIIVHGHQGSGISSLNPVVKDAFLTSEDMNVIVVDWSTYAALSYSSAVNAVPSVGAALAEFIQILLNFHRVSLDRLHLVGFELGAHVVGFTGRRFNGRVARITGLDPAGSRWGSASQRLGRTDALYVEVLHTDGDGLTSNGLGTDIGHVDFFANGGGYQPGCLTHSCSHNRAWELFAASLIHNHLIGNLCNNSGQLNLNRCRGYTLHMGNNDLVKLGAGIFRVNTGRRFPF